MSGCHNGAAAAARAAAADLLLFKVIDKLAGSRKDFLPGRSSPLASHAQATAPHAQIAGRDCVIIGRGFAGTAQIAQDRIGGRRCHGCAHVGSVLDAAVGHDPIHAAR